MWAPACLQVERHLTIAAAHCISCIAAAPPAQPNRQEAVAHLVHPLAPALQQLLHWHQQQDAAMLYKAAAAVEQQLKRLLDLLGFITSWRLAAAAG